jgi:hypothetical protein
MYDVVVYFSSLPRIADHDRKVQIMRAFSEGCKRLGLRVLDQTKCEVVDCKLAVMIGWVGQTFKGPHIHLRNDVINYQRATGNHVMPIDGSCFKFADPNSMYVRYSLDGVFYNQHEYANKNSSNQKWNQIRHDLKIPNMLPYRTTGNHIVICLQRDGGWNMKGEDLDRWLVMTVKRIRAISNRPILIRPHPKRPMTDTVNKVKGFPNVYESVKSSTLDQDLEGAWAAVFYNSSSSVAAILKGVPVYVSDEDAVTYKVANTDLSNIDTNPNLPDREQWLWDLAACHWSDEELRQGLVYKHFKGYLKA